jgi:hypothetical protein
LAKGRREGDRWAKRDDHNQFSSIAQQKADRAKKLLAAQRAAEAPVPRISRLAPDSRVQLRYATTAAPLDWLLADRSEAIFGPILDSIEDGGDRLVLAWPNGPGGGFTQSALALKHARATGRLAFATIGLWPWRSGATWAARSILVNPADLAKCAAFYATELSRGAHWAQTSLAHASLGMIEMRLRDLAPTQTDEARRVVVRSPTLLETTIVFPPQKDAPHYQATPDQVLRRVRDHTNMRERNAGLEEHVAAVSEPATTPYAVFGLPVVRKANQLQPFLRNARFDGLGLDVIVVDMTRTGRSDLVEDWHKPFETFLEGLSFAVGRRPPVVILTDDVYVWNKVGRVLRGHAANQRPAWKRASEVGALMLESGLLGAPAVIADNLPTLRVSADIKDASLAPLRRTALSLGQSLKDIGATALAEGVSEALSILRRSANAPLGTDEAATILDILYGEDDELQAKTRALFRPKMALARLAAIAAEHASFATAAGALLSQIEKKLEGWRAETPVSLKLASILATTDANTPDTLITMPDRRVVEAYLASDRAMAVSARVVDHRNVASALGDASFRRLIAIGPTPELVRTLLTDRACPEDVTILGDAAGTTLILAQLWPLTRVAAFAGLAPRAQALLKAFERGGSDEALDLAEAQFRIVAAPSENNIDFTQAGEAWEGDVIELRTRRVPRLGYRPNSDVLVYSPGETRPFERKAARDVVKGDFILVLDAKLREPLRVALAGSKKALGQLVIYHQRMDQVLAQTPGASHAEKARHVLAAMRALDPSFGVHEAPNVIRWLTAGQSAQSSDGARQPRAARDKTRFDLFMRAVGVDAPLAEIYWHAAITPSRAYRALEGYLFNQRVVQFVLDPEGAVGAGWADLGALWQNVTDAVDEVVEATTIKGKRHG